MCVSEVRSGSLLFARFNFQACSFNHSDISPFRIKGLRANFIDPCDQSGTKVAVDRPETERLFAFRRHPFAVEAAMDYGMSRYGRSR